MSWRGLLALALLAAVSWLVQESAATEMCDGKGYLVEWVGEQGGHSRAGTPFCGRRWDIACDWSPILLKCVDGFTIQPEDVVAVVGEMVQMDCQYEDDRALSWLKDGTAILSDSEDTFVHPNGTLQFNSVDMEDVGTYECRVQLGFTDFRTCSAELRLAGELGGGGWAEGTCFHTCTQCTFACTSLVLSKELCTMSLCEPVGLG